jgi:hypothetical protein
MENDSKLDYEEIVIKELIKSLGGNRFFAMTGTQPKFRSTKDNGDVETIFKLKRNLSKCNYMKIIYRRCSDLYDMEFIKVNGTEIHILKEYKGVYCDMLTNIFSKTTEMYTQL